MEYTLDKHIYTQKQIIRSESKLIEAEDYTSIETGQAYLAARGNHGNDSRPMGNPNGPQTPCGIYSSNVGKPQKHLTSLLPACCNEQNDTNHKYCSTAG